ncbi:MAG: SDR family oxidoreductase [Anaerolineales bacterium]|nr:SDR family oxidoreductase [Anaerolineales bacterium]
MSKTILITGASTGIGKAGALELGRRGWKVFVHARSAARGEPVMDDLKKNAPNAEFVLVTGDVSSMAEVKSLAEQVKAQTETLDVLWNNAGLMLDERRVSADGWEMTMAINHLAPFVLTRELLPLIEQTQGRVITTSSGGYMFGSFNWDDWMDEKSTYSSFKAYSKSKLANILFTRELAHRVGAKSVTAHCFHPGMVSTEFGRQRGEEKQKSYVPGGLFRSLFMLDPQAGADTGIFLAEDPSAKNSNGKFWIKRKIRRTKSFDNDINAVKLWELSEKATS